MDLQNVSVAVGPPDVSTAGPPVYANVTHVSFTPHDFRVTFSLLFTPHDGGSGPPVLAPEPRAVADIVLPAGAVESFIDILRAQLDRFVDRFGPPAPLVARSDSDRSSQ